MSTPNAAASGQFKIGGEIAVTRLGFGAMRITGPGVWGQPKNREACLSTLRRLPPRGA
jgi:pyridoxine 4-dehydrogenase